jgi:hypothetical protein
MSDVVPTVIDGTARHYLQFLDWAADKGELPKTMVNNWRNATRPILEIEPEWLDIDLMSMDIDQFFGRFETLNRTRYSQGSLSAYRNRFRNSVEAFRLWAANDPSWKPNGAKRGSVRATRLPPPKTGQARTQPSPRVLHSPQPTTGRQPSSVNLIEYPFPVRPGVQVRLVLPEDLNIQEARRLGAFISSLAVPEDDDGQAKPT